MILKIIIKIIKVIICNRVMNGAQHLINSDFISVVWPGMGAVWVDLTCFII